MLRPVLVVLSLSLLGGCVASSNNDLDGTYLSDVIPENPLPPGVVRPFETIRRDVMVLKGDRIEYFSCDRDLPSTDGLIVPDTMIFIHYYAGHFEIARDTMASTWEMTDDRSYTTSEKVRLDTIPFVPTVPAAGPLTVKARVIRSANSISLEFPTDSTSRFVVFRKRPPPITF